jgi:hypothetical protein
MSHSCNYAVFFKAWNQAISMGYYIGIYSVNHYIKPSNSSQLTKGNAPLVPPRYYYNCTKAAVWDFRGRNTLVGHIL